RSHPDRGRASDRRAGVASEQRHHGQSCALRPTRDHGGDWRERPLWRFRRALGTDQGVRRQRGAHCPQGHGARGSKEESPARVGGAAPGGQPPVFPPPSPPAYRTRSPPATLGRSLLLTTVAPRSLTSRLATHRQGPTTAYPDRLTTV